MIVISSVVVVHMPDHRKIHLLSHPWDQHDHHKLRNGCSGAVGQAFCHLLGSPRYSLK
jgi:hypothetical protein